MTGQRTVTLLVAISLLVAGSVAWKDWLRSREREHNKEALVRLSQEETSRLDLGVQAMRQKLE